ncbi:MAG: sigma-54-dependent Fis family transcriptional regulator [Spirochaetes bacterium]|nr:MAG: sigma-54-dependent Fis family transcriptional regulator [Spirochaetota bacterium]RKX76157.1 MAG: sigma-54-dependent Fis family transcriptional regulator [Spirochaetota bacterium]RKX84997.1 MAG: sigma-54-dependent Fis family transcriptional regulator [Spirochaetota bacterium]RKX95515.1 MAG: sigma-54-dependent Fis family transcriptional regulator [Spirochaetota bacterium]
MTFRILIVDDEKNIRNGLSRAMEMDGYLVSQAEDGQEALKMMLKMEIDLIIADLRMPKLSGEDLLMKVVSAYPTVPVIILTGHGTVDNAVQAMRNGAYDFLTKPVNLDRLGLLVKRALGRRELARKHQELEAEISRLEKRKSGAEILGKSAPMHRVFELIEQVAPTRASVLITGESGTGKELVANALHTRSPRIAEPLVKVHCAALSESLLESELFGHEKGAFTGAAGLRKGRFELADRGTIFLDEIGEIDKSTQLKILRVLQEKSFERVGGEKTLTVDVRIITATNRNLKEEVEKGRFREDLYYRLNVVNIHLPALRERPEDIPLLAARFLKETAEENGRDVQGLEPKAAMALGSYRWPGNVRELRNVVESAVVLSKGPYITPEDLPPHITQRSEEDGIRIPLGVSMSEAERIIIRANLNALGGNKSRTSEVLGIGRKTLHRKIHEYGMESEFLKNSGDDSVSS